MTAHERDLAFEKWMEKKIEKAREKFDGSMDEKSPHFTRDYGTRVRHSEHRIALEFVLNKWRDII